MSLSLLRSQCIWSAHCSGSVQRGCKGLSHQHAEFSPEVEKNKLKTSKEELPLPCEHLCAAVPESATSAFSAQKQVASIKACAGMDFSCAHDMATSTNRAHKYLEKIENGFKQANIKWLELVQKTSGLFLI